MILQVNDVKANYGGIEAVKGVSLHIKERELVAVLGANGAGKSTLLKCISSMMKPSAGTITYGETVLPSKPYDVVGMGIVLVPEGRRIFSKLTVEENLMTGSCQRNDQKEIKDDMEFCYDLFPRLFERKKQYGGFLSGGEQQMLAVARGLMARPKLLMLDEPSLGLAPIIVNQIFDILIKIRDRRTSILLVEQNAKKALSICDRGYVLTQGKIVAEGSGEALSADSELTSAYLG